MMKLIKIIVGLFVFLSCSAPLIHAENGCQYTKLDERVRKWQVMWL